MIDSSKKIVMEEVQQDLEPLTQKCQKVKSTLLGVSRNLKSQIDANAQENFEVRNQRTSRGTGVDFSGDIARLDNRLSGLESETANLFTQSEGISFNNMGFRSKRTLTLGLEHMHREETLGL